MKIPVELTAYSWHALLTILEHRMNFVNLDNRQAEELWRAISEQLNQVEKPKP